HERHERGRQPRDHRPLPVDAHVAVGGRRGSQYGRLVQLGTPPGDSHRLWPAGRLARRRFVRPDHGRSVSAAPPALRNAVGGDLPRSVIKSPETVSGVYGLLFPIAIVSNTFADPGQMPAWLGVIAEWNPLSFTVTALRELFGNPVGVGGSWIVQNALFMATVVPLVLTVVFFLLSVRAYRRLSRGSVTPVPAPEWAGGGGLTSLLSLPSPVDKLRRSKVFALHLRSSRTGQPRPRTELTHTELSHDVGNAPAGSLDGAQARHGPRLSHQR